jgi:hypothetical protein
MPNAENCHDRMLISHFWPPSGIYTYGGQGLAKHGIHVESHAILYDEAKGGPRMSPREPQLERDALAVVLASRAESLDPMSRANFGELHTIQHNVEICHIGEISPDSMSTFHAYVNDRFDRLRYP